MSFRILIAEPRDILRTGLHTIFARDERVTTLYEASNSEELQKHLRSSPIDLIIVNQAMVSDITTLPSHRFALLTPEFNITTFLMAYKHGAKGYLLENSQAELFRTLLSLPYGTFLIEPSLTANIVEYLTNDARLLVDEELLTPRERQIVGLLREGIDRPTIAQQLNISGATLKTHIKNIFRKRVNTTV
jgi:DNA-binding NarL/FixJ family response regulator